MKRVILFSALAFSAFALSASEVVEIIHDQEAQVEVPRKNNVGGATRIVIDGKSYLVDTVGEGPRKSLDRIVSAHQFHGVDTSTPGLAVGYVVKEKGHFPNPTAEFEVFYALELRFAVPKAIKPAPLKE